MAKILLIEDDRSLAKMVEKWMMQENYSIDLCHDGAEGLDYLLINEYDLALVDWELPSLSGIEIVKQFRTSGGQVPIIFLTGKSNISDKEHGLDTGADDYLTKPFSLKELAARVRAILRRPSQVVSNILSAGDVILDTGSHTISKAGEAVHLSPKDFELLEFLMKHPGQVFSSDSLLMRLWPTDSDATSDALRSSIKRIRKKIDESIIENVPKVGYRIKSS